MKKIPLIAVVGPTASGKTKLAVDIAKEFNFEIVSFDSMQVYKEIGVSTAKPTIKEMQGIKHHLIDCLSIDESFSVASFCEMAKQKVDEIIKKGKLPLFVGGTGLYIDSFVNNVDFSIPNNDEKVREKIDEIEKEKGSDYLYELLKEVDFKASETVHKNNVKRVKRALEIYYSTGINKTNQDKAAVQNDSPYNCLYLGLNFKSREALYDRINLRVEKMLENGLVDEAKAFFENKTSKTSVQAIGIKELKPYLDGEKSLDECVEKIKQESRRYAKRQLTWFRRNDKINWFYADEQDYESLKHNCFDLVKEFIKEEK